MTKADRQWILDVFIFCTLHLFELLRLNLWCLKINCYSWCILEFLFQKLNAGKTIKCNLHWKETEWILVQCKLFANSYPDSIIRTLLCRWPVETSQAIHLSFHLSVHWRSHVRGIYFVCLAQSGSYNVLQLHRAFG